MREQHIKNIKKEFLEPAFAVLVEKGLENTSVRDLCKALGVSAGSIYYWFKDKEDMYVTTVKSGINSIADALFEFAFKTMQEPKVFFEGFIDELDKYKKEFRLVVQFTTSPVYGKHVREKAEEFKEVYAEYIAKLSEMVHCPVEELGPIIYLLISIVTDYVVWEDREASDMQMAYLYKMLMEKIVA